MGKISRKDGYHVAVCARVPLGRSDWSEEEEKRILQDIRDQIKRHIDDVGYCEIGWDTTEECEYCGELWSKDGSNYNGGCCDDDELLRPSESEGE